MSMTIECYLVSCVESNFYGKFFFTLPCGFCYRCRSLIYMNCLQVFPTLINETKGYETKRTRDSKYSRNNEEGSAFDEEVGDDWGLPLEPSFYVVSFYIANTINLCFTIPVVN